MRRLSIHQFSSYRWSFFHDVVRYAGLGCHSIGLWRSKVEDFGFEEAADLLHEMRMDVSSFSWAGGFTGCEGNSFALAVDDAIQAIYQSHMVGASKLIIYPGARNGHTESHAVRLLRQAMSEMLPIARDLGVQLLLEPMVSKKNPWNFMTRFDDYVELLSDYCPSEVGLVLDLFHVGLSQTFAENIGQLANRIELVQLSDGQMSNDDFVRCAMGQGRIPIDSWIQTLEELEYSGDYEVELHGANFENADYLTLIQESGAFFDKATSKTLSGI